MATVRIYYSRADNNQSDYDVYWFADDPKKIDHSNFNVNFHHRTKVSFSSNDYVDIDTGDETVISWYIKRKDGAYDYNGEYTNYGPLTYGPTWTWSWEIGYQWKIDLNITPQSNFYVNNTTPYVYKDDTYTDILANAISFVGEEDLEADGDNDVPVEDDKLRIFYDLSNYKDVEIPEDEVWFTKWEPYSQWYKTTINRIQLLYLLNKSYLVGENDMDLSIDADALQVEKDDAKQMLEKAVANCLYKLGEDIAAFDEDAFLADVDAYKATKSSTLEATIDYLDTTLTALKALA